MEYGYQPDKRQKQIEQEFIVRMSFDDVIKYFAYITKKIEQKWSV